MHFYTSCSAVELDKQSLIYVAVSFPTDLFFQSQKPFQFSFSVILRTRTDVRIWDHLGGQVQSCHTVWILLLLSAPGGLVLSSLCTFGVHLCLAGFTGVNILLLLLPTGILLCC